MKIYSQSHHHRFYGCLLIVAVILLSGCAGLQPENIVDRPMQLRNNLLIVTLAPATQERWTAIAKQLERDYQLKQMQAFPLSSLDIQCIIYRVPENQTLASTIEKLGADARVETVQRNQIFTGAARSDQYAQLQYGAKAVRADAIHRWTTGKGIKVALIDTGVDKDHPDLQGQIIETANFVQNGDKSFNQDRHGTAVAGVIGAKADNEVGIFGIAPGSGLVALKACWQPDVNTDKALCGSWSIAQAIDFAIMSQVRVLNMSLAGPFDPLIERLLSTAQQRDIIAVAAAADADASAPAFPASMASVIAVVASDQQGQIQPPTWRKDDLLLAAPGVEILTTLPDGHYDFLSGSSLSTAHVAGVLALLLEQNPELSPPAAADLLQTTAKPIGNASIGLLDAWAALQQLIQSSEDTLHWQHDQENLHTAAHPGQFVADAGILSSAKSNRYSD